MILLLMTLDIYITKNCNLNCQYCYATLSSNKDYFNFKKFKEDIIPFVLNKGIDTIKILGGEPLLRKGDILRIVRLLKINGYKGKIVIVTNGLLLDKLFLKKCKKNNISLIISIHKSSVKLLLKKISLFYEYKSLVTFSILIGPDIYFVKVLEILYACGFKQFTITPLITWDWLQNKDKFKEALNKLKKILLIKNDVFLGELNYRELEPKIGFCKKYQIDNNCDFKPCTRFGKVFLLKNLSFKKNIEKYNKIYLKNKYNFSCPIGFELDFVDKDIREKIEFYTLLNFYYSQFLADLSLEKSLPNFWRKDIEEIRFNIIDGCNIRCNYCYIGYSNRVLNLSKAKAIVDWFLNYSVSKNKTISFFGGEPLLKFNIVKNIVLYANSFGKKVSYSIATNGLLLNINNLDFMRNNNFDIHVSFNGNKEVHNFTRDNSFESLIEKFKLLSNYGKNKKAILLTLFPFSYKYLTEFFENILSFGFNRVLLEFYLGDRFSWEEKDVNLFKNTLLNAYKKYRGKIILLNLFHTDRLIDIDINGKCYDNSFEIYKEVISFNIIKRFNRIIKEVWK